MVDQPLAFLTRLRILREYYVKTTRNRFRKNPSGSIDKEIIQLHHRARAISRTSAARGAICARCASEQKQGIFLQMLLRRSDARGHLGLRIDASCL